MKIKASRLYELFPVYNQFAASPIDNGMSVKLAIAARAIRPIFDEIEKGRNNIVRKYASPDPEKKGSIIVLAPQLSAYNTELDKFWEKLGELEIHRPSLTMEDLNRFGCFVPPNVIETIIELCIDDPSHQAPGV